MKTTRRWCNRLLQSCRCTRRYHAVKN